MKSDKEARTASDAELMQLVCDSITPQSAQQRDDLQVKLQRTQGEALDWRRVAKLAADDLRAYQEEIHFAAAIGQKQFFIDLGKSLSGEVKSGYDRLDADIAAILSRNPSIKAKDAVRELVRLNHPCISEENFRMRKKRLKALAGAIREVGDMQEAKMNEFIKEAQAREGIYITRITERSAKRHATSITRGGLPFLFRSISAAIAKQQTPP